MTARRPIRRGLWVQWDVFISPGNYHDIAQVADSHSPVFIQLEVLGLTVGQTPTEQERSAIPCKVQIVVPYRD
jgi:hypothetical protein